MVSWNYLLPKAQDLESTMSAIPALEEECENTLNPHELNFLIIILLQNRTQLSIQNSFKSPPN